MLSDTMMLGGGRKAAYPIENSLLFRGGQYLSRTPSVAGNRDLWTLSMHVRRSVLGAYQYVYSAGPSPSTIEDFAGFDPSDRLMVRINGVTRLRSSQVFRDPTAWGHMVVTYDAANDTVANRLRVYWNGAEITSWETDARGSLAVGQAQTNTTVLHCFGRNVADSTGEFGGYLTEVAFADNAALTPASFGEVDSVTGSWRPKKLTGITWGTNGFYLGKPWDAENLGRDSIPGEYVRIYGGAPSAPHGGSASALNDNDLTTSCSMLAFNGVTSIQQGIVAKIDLGSLRNIRKLEATGAYWTHATTGTLCRFYVSEDGVNWSQFGADSMMGIASAPLTASATGSAVARYVAYGLLVGSWYGDYYTISLSELRVFGEGIYSGNDWKAMGFTATDVMTDTPTNVHATLNPLVNPLAPASSATLTFSNGNLSVGYAGVNTSGKRTISTQAIRPQSGKFYFAMRWSGWNMTSQNSILSCGIDDYETAVVGAGGTDYAYAVWRPNLSVRTFSCGSQAVPIPYLASGDWCRFAYDSNTGKVWFGINSQWFDSAGGTTGDPANGLNPTVVNSFTKDLFAYLYVNNDTANANWDAEFGATGFTYAPPAGFKSLCSANVPPTTGTTGGTFTGNANADGPCIFTGAVPLTLTINNSEVVWGTHADKLATGFKIRTASASYNGSGSNSWMATYDRKPTVGPKGRAPANAQVN